MHDETKREPEVITNPVTGEVIRVLASTPELFRFEFVLLPHGGAAAPHPAPAAPDDRGAGRHPALQRRRAESGARPWPGRDDRAFADAG
jgi:hypothetical protein